MPRLRYQLAGDAAILFISRNGTDYPCLIDRDDLLIVAGRSLSIYTTRAGTPYIQMTGPRGRVTLHRHLLGLSQNDGLVADHINGQTLDNRRCNLRAVSQSINLLNRPSCGRSGVAGRIRGITPTDGKFDADLAGVYLGRFADIRDAVETVWLCLLAVDPIAADRYLRELPESLEKAA